MVILIVVLTYKVDVFTGDLPEAGTSAEVYAMLVGDRGDTGHRKLLKSLTANSKEELFQPGKVSIFKPLNGHAILMLH